MYKNADKGKQKRFPMSIDKLRMSGGEGHRSITSIGSKDKNNQIALATFMTTQNQSTDIELNKLDSTNFDAQTEGNEFEGEN